MPAYCGLGLDHSIVGRQAGKWTRIGPSFVICTDGKQRRRVAVCRCECGSIHVVSDGSCRPGGTGGCRACGSRGINTTHGMSTTAEYQVYAGMLERCFSPRSANFKKYGAKGIRVCDEWRGYGGFQAFLSHVGPRPSDKHWIERIDSKGHYEPGNVCWATPTEQARNRSNNVILVHDGRAMCQSAWSEETGISPALLSYRLSHGWSVEKALTTPPKKTNQEAIA